MRIKFVAGIFLFILLIAPVVYAYAAQFPAEVEKLAAVDAFLPGVEGWEPIYNNPAIWHFRFNRPKPEALVAGREPIYFSLFWGDLAAAKNRSLREADRKAYIDAIPADAMQTKNRADC
ncbi:MAG TPA: hypothetical protein VK685_05700 [Candidatus Acidoferrum sp.]|jgi:pimeloyl-ACP methyl ester carboxylesterase|nr:hypothetical protein [Candidatus Acidoferrum sp.]